MERLMWFPPRNRLSFRRRMNLEFVDHAMFRLHHFFPNG
jgi:hypothetical protein